MDHGLHTLSGRLTAALFGAVWLALSLVLAQASYGALPWLVETVPPSWIVRYLEWYASVGAEFASSASFLAVFALCSVGTAAALSIPFALALTNWRTGGGADWIRTSV